jgi:hypothetical protein
MITVDDIKPHQESIWEDGASHPAVDVLILASCRGIAYANYLTEWNKLAGGVRVTYIRASDYHTTRDGQPQDINAALARLVASSRFKQVTERTTHFIYEHHQNYGPLNTTECADGGIMHQLWNKCAWSQIPSWNNHFVLEDDIRACLPWFTKAANSMDRTELAELLRHTTSHALFKFVQNTHQTNFPHFAEWFLRQWRTQRLFWTHNHVTKALTEEVFNRLNMSLLDLPLTPQFWRTVKAMPDLYENPHTNPTPLDREVNGIQWD